jgi:hypothetical protein
MPIKIDVALSKQIDLPDQGCLTVSCALDADLPLDSLDDPDGFRQYVGRAFAVCRRVLDEELVLVPKMMV